MVAWEVQAFGFNQNALMEVPQNEVHQKDAPQNLMNEQTENLQEAPSKQTKSSPFWLMLLGVPVAFLFVVLAVMLVNVALPVADAERFKALIFGGGSGAGVGATLLGAYGFVSRSLKMTDGKIANNTPSSPSDLTGLVANLAVNALANNASAPIQPPPFANSDNDETFNDSTPPGNPKDSE